jgi:hypothetical protein
MGLWDVEALTYSRQSVRGWRWGCQPYVPGSQLAFTPLMFPGTHFC